MAGANPKDSALVQRMRQQADAAEAEEKAKAEAAQADADWEALRDPQGRLYYHNARTGETSWQLPSEKSAPGRQPPALLLQPQALSVPSPVAQAPAPSSLDDMASSALAQAVATIQQLTEDVAQQHRAKAELEEQLAQAGTQGEALKEMTDKSVALLKENKAAATALDAERQRREQAEAAFEQARAVGAKVAELEAERNGLRQTVAMLEKKTKSSGKLAQVWKQIDDDDSGELDARELKKVMVLMGKDESSLDMRVTMAALDKDKSGSVSFGEFQTWWDEQDQSAQDALTRELREENEQLKKDVEGAKTRADKIFREQSETLKQRDRLREQLSKAMGITTKTLPRLHVETPESNTAATIQREEALELIPTIESEEEARAVCKEVGIRNDTTLSKDAMIMALKGYYDHDLTPEQAFAAQDVDGSGALNSFKVQCAVAMLGYLVEDEALPDVMASMDADGGGGVELGEFLEWCESSMDPKFDQASIDAFERKLELRETERKNAYARLQKLTVDVQELRSTNKQLQEALDAAKAETAAAKAEAASAMAEAASAEAEAAAAKVESSAATDQSASEDASNATETHSTAGTVASGEHDAALAKISALQAEIDELQSLVAVRDRKVASMGSDVKALEEQLNEVREEYDEVTRQRDALRHQLSSVGKQTSAVMKRMNGHQQSDLTTSSTSAEEAMELLEMLDSAAEAKELCEDLGMQVDDDLPLETLLAALKGHFDQDKTVEEVFEELDEDESGYLDEGEVRAAIAMLGFAVDSANLALVLKEMDPDGNGEVTLDEFRGWWSANISTASNGGAGGNMQEVIELKMQLTEAHDKLKKLEGRTRVTESDDPLQYVKSARTKLRKITPGGVQGKAPVKIDIDTEEVTELLSLLEDESEAAALCSESGLDLGNGDVSLETMKAALRGYFSKGLSVRHVFDELDVDDSGYLDQDEVEQAIAMLGFLTDDVAKVMDEMDPNGDGEVSFEEFQAWWKINMEDSTSDSAAEQGSGDAAMQEELLNLRRQLEAAVARGGGPPGGQDELDSEIVAATSERLQAAEAAEADARSQLAVMRKQLEEVKAKLAAVEAKGGAGAATEKQEKVVEPRAKLDAADSAVAEASDPMGMMSKLQEFMERAARAEAEHAVVARERDKALKELASAELQGRGSRDRRTAGGDGVKGQEIDSEDEDDEDDLQGQVEMLEQVVAARDAEVKTLTEKLKAFASETRRLIEQLRVETAKSKELAGHYSALQEDLDAAESKLDEMAQLNRTLVGQISELKGRLQSHQIGGAPDEV